MLWKHTDTRTGQVEVRRNRRLVISMVSTVSAVWHSTAQHSPARSWDRGPSTTSGCGRGVCAGGLVWLIMAAPAAC